MSVPPEQFSRIAASVNLGLLDRQLVVIVGVGTVGSQVANELARSGVGRLRLIDGDTLEITNLVRHVLGQQHIGRNKAEALTEYLADELPTLRAEALPRYVDETLNDAELDALLDDAHLVVAATDDREAQRRIGRRALALDIPALFPALYGNRGGEVVVQLGPEFPCFMCWDGFREETERLRAVTALNLDTLDIVQLAGRLCLGILDESSSYAELLRPERGEPQPQLFTRNEFALAVRPIQRRVGCPSCSVGPAPRRQEASRQQHPQPPTAWPAPEPTPRPSTAPRGLREGQRFAVGLLMLVVLGVMLGLILSPIDPFSSTASSSHPQPTSFHHYCERLLPGRGGIKARRTCRLPGVTLSIIFTRGLGGTQRDREIPSGLGLPFFGACPNVVPAQHAFYIGDQRIGSLFCMYNENGQAVLVWNDMHTGRAFKAVFVGYSIDEAYGWWTTHAYQGTQRPTPAPQD